MFGIDPLTVSSLLVLAGNTLTCPVHAPTKLNIVPKTEKVKYDYSQTLKQIQHYGSDTVDPYSFHGTSITQGFMKGGIQMKHRIKFGQSQDSKYNAACVWYDEITVEISIDPTIVIASELYRDLCMRKAILGHELKHVRVDREVVNKYSQSIGKKLMAELKSRGFTAGPFDPPRAKEVAQKMQHVVDQILELEYQKLGIERQEKQRAVDSLEEYDSVDDKCPSFESKKKGLYADLL